MNYNIVYFFIFVYSLIKYTVGILEFFKNAMRIRHRKNNILTSKSVAEKQSDTNTNKICDKIQEECECSKIQCCSKKSSGSLESTNCNFCCESEKVANDSTFHKALSSEKQCKTDDKFSSSNHCERRKSGETDDTIHGKLSCIIKRLDRLIDTCPSRNDLPNDCSATNQPASIAKVASPRSAIVCASKSLYNKEPVKNVLEKLSQKRVIPSVNTLAMPAKSLTETKSPNNCLAVIQHGITIGYIMYSAIDTCEVSCSKLSCNIEPVKNGCEEPSQEPVVSLGFSCNEKPIKCLSETKVQHNSTQSITQCPVDNPSKQNVIITPRADCSNEKSCCELQSIDLCTEAKDNNQKGDCCTAHNNCNVIKDEETNKNTDTEKPAKPKTSPVPVKSIKNTTKPKTSNKQKPGNGCDDIKVKPNSKHNKLNKLNNSEKKM